MSIKYNHSKIEKKWQKIWQQEKTWKVIEDKDSPKFYVLDMFPYPSAEGLHVGHPEGYTASDILTRYMRMKGYNVLHPMGFDSFGLPAENFAIKTGTHPSVTTKKNIENMRQQIQSLGLSYDWSREVQTTDPDYYKWTQWIFLQMFKNGLAYEATVPINWCPSCKTGLANEEVVDGKCERCGAKVTKKNIRQWLLKITKYADRLLKGLDGLDWPEPIKLLQKNWIGRSEGAEVDFEIVASSRNSGTPRNDTIKVFTTRPDTLFGATYMVLAPEHPLVEKITTKDKQIEVKKYIEKAKTKSDLERTDLAKEKTGVFTGAYAINPVNNEKIPIWIADYVLISYGTGAIMAVPAHDDRDREFAEKYNLPSREVIKGMYRQPTNASAPRRIEAGKGFSWTGPGKMVNSGKYNHQDNKTGAKNIVKDLEKKGAGKKSINYKLRDWVFSRQRYWGEPIPVVHCEECKKKDKKKVLIIHGTGGYGRKNWYGWLADELRSFGHEVFIPDLPDSDQPIFEKWIAALEQYQDELDENSVIIGHSLGGFTGLHLVTRLRKKINKLILIAPTHGDMDWEAYAKQHPREPVENQKKFHQSEVLYDKVHLNTEKIIYYYADNDFYLPKIIPGLYKKTLRADYRMLPGRDHFCIAHGNAYTFPELIVDIIGKDPLPLGVIPVSEKDLPVELPEVDKYEPTGTGESPLASIAKWVNVKCPKCKGKAKRETNTMPQWAGSCWYYLRYIDPDNKKELVGSEKEKYWMGDKGVDMYVGGAEHAVLHLLYARFWHMFLYDLGVVSTEEPFKALKNQGIILGEDDQKMSKSRGNVINPDEVIKEYGADSMRLYEMFMGPFEDVKPWSTQGIRGVYRFLNKVWTLQEKVKEGPEIEEFERLKHKLIKKVTNDIETFNFNTVISSFMEAVNAMNKETMLPKSIFDTLLILLSPFAPHITEELWEKMGHKQKINQEKWPVYDEKMIQEDTVQFIVQIDGKLRDKIMAPFDSTEKEVIDLVMSSDKIKKYIKGNLKKVIFIKNKLINLVV